MVCNQCGQQNPEAAVSCFRCGKPLIATNPTSTTGMPGQMVPPGAQPAAVAPQTDGKATASLILGILSMTCFGILTGIPAVILGHIAKSNIRKSLGRLKGDGMALAGLILGYISIAMIPVVLIVAAIAIPNLLRARIAANEAAAVASVRTISTASIAYQMDKKAYPSTLDDLQQAGLIDSQLAAGMKSGYRFSYHSIGDHFSVAATPVSQGNTGNRRFCSENDEIVRSATGREECTSASPPI